MARIRQQQLGGITVLDSPDFSDGYARNVSGFVFNSSSQPIINPPEGAVWYADKSLNFTNENETISLNTKIDFVHELLPVVDNQTEFVLSQLPVSNNDVVMFLNGLRVLSSDYVVDGVNLTYSGANLLSTDDVEFYYPFERFVEKPINFDKYINARVEPDANDIIVWAMSDTSMPVVNTGTAGSSANLVTAGVNGVSLGANSGVFGRASYIKPVPNNWLKTANSAGEYVGNQMNLSCWVFLTQYVDFGTIGRVVTKASQRTSWTSPFDDATIRFNITSATNSRLRVGLRAASGYHIVEGIASNLKAPLYQWIHIGFAYNGSSLVAYVNGVPLSTVNNSISGNVTWSSVAPGSGPWFVGSHYAIAAVSSRECAIGMVQDIRLATVARPESWWREVYSKGTGRSFIF
jgi:hypothetical protein